MNRLRLISLTTLEERLREALVAEPKLAGLFAEALRSRDDELLSAAFDRLTACAPETKRQVEETLVAWLFGDGTEKPEAQPPLVDSSTLADLPAASQMVH